MKKIIENCRLMESDHTPDGWPAIQMRHVTALCDEVERLWAHRDAMLNVLEELDDRAEHWEVYKPIVGMRERIKAAIKKARGKNDLH